MKNNSSKPQPTENATLAAVALDAIREGDLAAADALVAGWDGARRHEIWYVGSLVAKRDAKGLASLTKYVVCPGCGEHVYGPQMAQHEAGVAHEYKTEIAEREARGLVRVLDACAERIRAAGGLVEYGPSRYFPGGPGRVAERRSSHWSTKDLAEKHRLAPKKSKASKSAEASR